MTKHVSRLMVVFAGLTLFGLGCNPFAGIQEKVENKIGEAIVEKSLESASGGKVDVDLEDGITVKDAKTGEEASWGADVKLPSNFSSDLPKYTSGKVITAAVQNSGKQGSFMQVIEDKAETVLDWYDGELKSKGYTLTSETSFGITIREYEKPEMKISISVISGDDEENGKITTTLTGVYENKSE